MLFLPFAVSHCDYSNVSVHLKFNGETILNCPDAYITDLSPEDGGYRFHCEGYSIYVIYDTNGDMLGTIERIMITNEYQNDEVLPYDYFLSAYFVELDEDIDCPSAKELNRETGEDPFSTTLFGDIEEGTYTIMTADPCGEILLTIGSPN